MKRRRLSTLVKQCLALALVPACLPLSHTHAGTPGRNQPNAVITLQDINSATTPPPGNFRWLDAADQPYSAAYRTTYNYTQATVTVTYVDASTTLHGTLTAANLKPNFTFQLKLVGTPGTPDNERIGLAGRWWQEEWNGSAWVNGRNLNNKDDGTSPNPNDDVYFARRDITDASSPTGLHYRYTGYLVFDYFTTDGTGAASLTFEADSSYHVLWKSSQLARTAEDGPLKTSIFDADLSTAYEDTGGDDWPSQTAGIFGEWERLPVGGVYLQPGEYSAQLVLTEESFHGSGGTYAGGWAGAMQGDIHFTLVPPTAVEVVSFEAAPQAGAIHLTWETASEVFVGGFHLYRAGAVDGQRTRLNADLLPPQAQDTLMGASYRFVDDSVAPGVPYTYWLESVDVYGLATRHGPASATLTGFRVYLPFVVRQSP